MMIHEIPSTLGYNYWLKRLDSDTRLNESTNQNSLKVLKVVKPTNKKTLLRTFGTSVINSRLSSLCLTSRTLKKKDFNSLI